MPLAGRSGPGVPFVCRQQGISEATYLWKKRYANRGVLRVRELWNSETRTAPTRQTRARDALARRSELSDRVRLSAVHSDVSRHGCADETASAVAASTHGRPWGGTFPNCTRTLRLSSK